jgi:hypothetical protein
MPEGESAKIENKSRSSLKPLPIALDAGAFIAD